MSRTARGFTALLNTHRANQKYGYRSGGALMGDLRFYAGILIDGGYISDFDTVTKDGEII
jgi:hypothetical protein